jgi:hypothetical protein
VLVRGKSAKGASDVATGSIVDTNGDGVADFIAGFSDPGDEKHEAGRGFFVSHGAMDGTYALYDEKSPFMVFEDPELTVTGGTDMDGDGFADVLIGYRWAHPNDPTGTKYTYVDIVHGGPEGNDWNKDEKQQEVAGVFDKDIPVLHASGDLNGDGFGDVSISTAQASFAALGGANGSGTFMVFAYESPSHAAPPLIGGFDLDGDGLTDVAFASPIPSSPVFFARGAADRIERPTELKLGNLGTSTSATAFAAGDFDGDGTSDVAFVATFDGKAAVCIHKAKSGALQADQCWMPADAATGFAQSLAAGDVDADGRDDIIVGSTAGLSVVKMDASDHLVVEAITGTYGSRVTMIHPGRPGPAIWAALGADQQSINIFHGVAHKQKIAADATMKLGPQLR